MSDERFLGRILRYDPQSNILSIKVDFLTPEKQAVIEQIATDNKPFSFSFRKPYRKQKTYEQLKKYYKTLSNILIKLDIASNSENVKAFDESIKRRAFDCQTLHIMDKEIPLLPSKAEMSVEEMMYLIQYVDENYGALLEEEK